MPDAARYAREKIRLAAQGTTPYRRRIDRTRERVERVAGVRITRRHAAGHSPQGRSVSQLLHGRTYTASWYAPGPSAPGRVVTADVSYRDAQRAGRYLELTRRLQENRITPGEFQRRVQRWRPIAGVSFLADPRRVLALLVMGASEDVEFYTTRSRRQRSAA